MYQRYMTDSIQSLCKGEHEYIIKSYYDLLYPKEEPDKTAEEMVADVMQAAGLRFAEEKTE